MLACFGSGTGWACVLLVWVMAPERVQGQCGGTPACPTSAMPFGLPPANTEVGPPAFELGTGGVFCIFPAAPVLAATVTMQPSIQETILFTSGPGIEIISGGALSPNGPHVVTGMFVCAGGSVCLPGLTESFMVTDRAIGTVVADTLFQHLFPGPTADPLCPTCRGDMDGSGFVDTVDTAAFVVELLNPTPNFCADLTGDGNIDGRDIAPFVAALLATPLGTPCSAMPLSAAGIGTCAGGSNTFTLCVETINLITGVTTIECKSGLGDASFVIPDPVVPGVLPDSFTDGPISGTLVYTLNTVYQISGGVLTPIPLTTGSYVSHVPGPGGILVTTTGGTDLIPLLPGSMVVTYAPCALPMPACGTPAPTIAVNTAPCPDIAATAANWGPVPGITCGGGATGACCMSDGSCSDLDPATCTLLFGTPLAGPCVPTGCCLPSGACINTDPRCCALAGGVSFAGLCAPVQACCFSDGSCSQLEPTCCTIAGGAPDGVRPCLPPQKCCLPDNSCINADPACCVNVLNGATFNGLCVPVEACCFDDGTCSQLEPTCCMNAGGMPDGVRPCLPPQKCCLPDNSCINADPLCCVNVLNGATFPGLCAPVEACCFDDGTCSQLDPDCCMNAGGTPDGVRACLPPLGCCLPSGLCINADPACCLNVLHGTPLAKPCAPVQACCFDNGSCSQLEPTCCTRAGGTPNGVRPCAPVEACCFSDGTCQQFEPGCCTRIGGTPDGVRPCAPVEACCFPDGSCSQLEPGCCTRAGGTPDGVRACQPPQKCCLTDGSCVDADPQCCVNVLGGTVFAGPLCAAPQKCCLPDHSCIDTDPECCLLAGGTVFPGLCGQPVKCCLPDGTCVDTDPMCCAFAGGREFFGACADLPFPCGVPSGGDLCPDALLIGGEGTFPFDNSTATGTGPDHAACNFFGQIGFGNDVWFCWRATCDGFVRIETCGQTIVDTKLAVYDGCTCPPTDANLLACNDDDCSVQSGVNFFAVNGQDYLIRLGTFPGAAGGTGTFSIQCAPPPPPANDDCANAEPIFGPGSQPFDNTDATTDGNPDPLCLASGSQQINKDVWFCWTSPCSGPVIVTTVGLTGVDTKIAVYDGCACPAVNILACNDDDPLDGLQSTVTFTAFPFQTYLIRIGTFPGAAGGTGQFSITCSGP